MTESVGKNEPLHNPKDLYQAAHTKFLELANQATLLVNEGEVEGKIDLPESIQARVDDLAEGQSDESETLEPMLPNDVDLLFIEGWASPRPVQLDSFPASQLYIKYFTVLSKGTDAGHEDLGFDLHDELLLDFNVDDDSEYEAGADELLATDEDREVVSKMMANIKNHGPVGGDFSVYALVMGPEGQPFITLREAYRVGIDAPRYPLSPTDQETWMDLIDGLEIDKTADRDVIDRVHGIK